MPIEMVTLRVTEMLLETPVKLESVPVRGRLETGYGGNGPYG